MALVTKMIVRLMRQPELVKTILAIYDSADDAGETVAEITARAITPVAVEMLDGVMLRMVEEATHAGYPMDAAAVLLIELEGLKEAVEEQVEQIRDGCKLCRAREFRVAQIRRGTRSALEGPQERLRRRRPCQPSLLRAGRRGAAHQDRRRRSATSAKWQRDTASSISNIFHAGDGNMHPIILFDARKPGNWSGHSSGRRHPATTASASAAPSPASTEWAWRRWS